MLQIDANDEECFYDRVKKGTKMGLIFEVAEGGSLDIDVKIEGKSIFSSKNCQITHVILWKICPFLGEVMISYTVYKDE